MEFTKLQKNNVNHDEILYFIGLGRISHLICSLSAQFLLKNFVVLFQCQNSRGKTNGIKCREEQEVGYYLHSICPDDDCSARSYSNYVSLSFNRYLYFTK